MKINVYKRNNKNDIGLRLKEVLDENNLFIDSYSKNSIKIRNKTYKFPICIIGHVVYEINFDKNISFTIEKIKKLNERFFKDNQMYPELFLIALSKNNYLEFSELRKKCSEFGFGIEIMKTSSACGTFNLLTIEKRNFVAIFT